MTLYEQFLEAEGLEDSEVEKLFAVFNTKDAINYLFPRPEDKIHINTMYKMCKTGQLGHFHQGNHFKFYKKHLDKFRHQSNMTEKFECFICQESTRHEVAHAFST